MSSNAERLEKALTALPSTADPQPLFARAGRVVGLGSDEGAPALNDTTDAAMYGLLVRVANWLRITRDEETVSVAAELAPELSA